MLHTPSALCLPPLALSFPPIKEMVLIDVCRSAENVLSWDLGVLSRKIIKINCAYAEIWCLRMIQSGY
jgi:hypothetical protein